jgi:transposase-like protein
MVSSVRELMSRTEDARSLIQALYKTEVDLIPNDQDGTLKVRLHQLANRSTGKIIQHLCKELNATQTKFPGTNLQLIYELVS